ncbi:hypothetical protein [Metabacillus niabensis]|uniref:Uncharacterized protein n=1 Tax=Metabacillus niabensis TaxID=324854 RepID=A0ABT9YZI7_9BACI|nr:hypothetical protein [Metabacillus niabensis]MDQ0225195.1 hypothetical protein [Metabacillus niabensis]
MRRIRLYGEDIFIIRSRRVDDEGFSKAIDFLTKSNRELLKMKKSSSVLLQDKERNSIVVERINTDTFTLLVQYEINCQKVYQIQ